MSRIGGLRGRTKVELRRFARSVLVEHQPELVISGMALGWDQAVAHAAVDLGFEFVAVIPFEGQEGVWEPDERAEYQALRAKASYEVVVDPGAYSREAMMRRNERMVDMADGVLALWDGSRFGGTFQCLLYAHGRECRVYHLWQSWQDHHKSLRV